MVKFVSDAILKYYSENSNEKSLTVSIFILDIKDFTSIQNSLCSRENPARKSC
jgi:hypothetical protein